MGVNVPSEIKRLNCIDSHQCQQEKHNWMSALCFECMALSDTQATL